MQINGIVLLNKDRGISSNKTVNKVKYLLQADKAGHLGTLDVLGEGLLPITLGKGTKLFDYFLNKDKVYKTIFKFGETTDTLDLEGPVTKTNDVVVTMEMINNILPKYIGKMNQLPPIYSAKKVKGHKAYDLARQGIEVDLKTKEIEIYSIKCLKQLNFNTFEFEIHCSSGTYIRSICRDLANDLNTYGVMLSIIRTRCGMFSINNAYTLNDIEKNNFSILPLESCFDFLIIDLDEEKTSKLLNGVKITYKIADGKYKVFNNNLFLGIAKVINNIMSFELRLI